MDSDKFSKRKLRILFGFMLVVFVSMGSTAAGDNTLLELNGGNMDVNGNNIVDSGTTIWDASSGYIPEAQLQTANLVWSDLGIAKTDVSKSDVGLGNVENIGLSNAAGQDLAWDSSNSEFDATDTNTQLDDELATSSVDMNGYDLDNANEITTGTSTTGTNQLHMDFADNIILKADKTTSSQLRLHSAHDEVELAADRSGSAYYCDLSPADGTWECDGDIVSSGGTKNWIHDLGNGSEAVYTSQESPQVRAVYEGMTNVTGETRVELPSHFSKTVSDSEPKLRATATVQGKLAYAAVIEKTDEYLVLDSSESATVNYRITGIREGYEDKQVVREKEE